MGKALMVANPSVAIADGFETNFFGTANHSSTEGFTQYTATEAATISKLGASVVSGGSGTNTFQFRKNGANGNQVVSFAGASSGEDASNTDALSANDEFNIAYTDTGTDSTLGPLKANVEFASGHGNFHGTANYVGTVYDVESATQFLAVNGAQISDGTATIAHAQWKNRGYTSWAAFQINVSANARTNDSILRSNINGSNGGLAFTIGTGVTGTLIDDTPADSLSGGDLICLSLQLDTGTEDLTVRMVGSTLKSSTLKSEIWTSYHDGQARTASSTATYIPVGGRLDLARGLTEAQARVKPGFASVVSELRCYVSANTLGGTMTVKLMQNGSAVTTLNVTSGAANQWFENTVDSITIDDDDELSFELDEGTSGSVTIHAVGITFSPIAAAGSPPKLIGGKLLHSPLLHGLLG